ncbi:hypothetical protein D9V77_00475 [Buchnera aphidicola (Sitobion avenae)]|uniref:Lipoprotein n=1 Tax=Buchnera aphidicola (Sitobion avenae) TaxID=571428 RepID=A0A4D6Y6E8_9GAMM|nr:hypothetical protein [Buchnera aphidicola]QCI25326.1 hypothetical protein D9V77_00475 [Buchnera aphidicola (Sitobion avenae)]
MPILKHYKKFLKIIITFQMLNTLFITSCTLKDFKRSQSVNSDNIRHQFRKLIIPEGINIPDENKDYSIPYTDKDLEKKDFDIFPPA